MYAELEVVFYLLNDIYHLMRRTDRHSLPCASAAKTRHAMKKGHRRDGGLSVKASDEDSRTPAAVQYNHSCMQYEL